MAGTKDNKTALRAASEPVYKYAVPDKFTEKELGCKGLYTDEILPHVEELCRAGLNNKQIAQSLGIGIRTFYEWIDRFPLFAHSIKKYRGLADIQVENALFKSAIGFNFEEVKRERRKVDGQYQMVETEKVIKHVPGVSAAQIFYLKNRMPERYKDKIETVHSLDNSISAMAFCIKRRGEEE